MPLYEYVCDRCAAEFEALVRGHQQPECPKCGGDQLQKLMSVPAAHVNSGASSGGCPPALREQCEEMGGGCGMGGCGML